MQSFEDPSSPVEPKQFLSWCQNEDPFDVIDYKINDVIADQELGWVLVSSTTKYKRIASQSPVELTDWEKWRELEGTWRPVPKNKQKDYPESPALRDTNAERELRKRVDESWNARKNHDYQKLLELGDPEDLKKATPEEFAESEKLMELMVCEVHWVQAIGDHGQVRVTYKYKLNDPSLTKMPPRERCITEQWIRRNGLWYSDLKPH